MNSLTNIKYLLINVLILIIVSSCNSKDNKLKKYYESNHKLHQELSDSLMNFCRNYGTEITLQKSQLPDRHIILNISFPDSAQMLPIYFDTSYNRQDYKHLRTGEFVVPKAVIEKFDRSIYFGIGADSSYTFFAYKWNKPKVLIGTSGDSQYGILILKDTVELNKYEKKISINACITSYGVF